MINVSCISKHGYAPQNAPFYDKYWKKYKILGYINRQSVAMTAMLNNENFLRWDFGGVFTRVLSGHPSNFPENFSFLHFFQVEP